MKRIALALLTLPILIGLAPFAAPLRAQAPETPPPMTATAPSLTVQGTAEVRADPDEATVRLGVVAQAPNARAAQEKTNQSANAILAAIRGLGVEAKNVQTLGLSLTPLYANIRPDQRDQEPRITGYQAANTVSVRLQKLDLIGQMIDAGLAAGANQVEGVDFGLRDEEPVRARALAQAVNAARDKAQAIAAALDVRLGEVVEVAEGVSSNPQPRFEGRMAMLASASQTPVSAGQLTVSASVTLRYRISP
ncbi:MAG TPA: SIMPL domain-containing protein [Thermoanaerobaculia bacterium]|nr:SIMPL domain-containing protein [Thermoanaerobaculia bacterium]